MVVCQMEDCEDGASGMSFFISSSAPKVLARFVACFDIDVDALDGLNRMVDVECSADIPFLFKLRQCNWHALALPRRSLARDQRRV